MVKSNETEDKKVVRYKIKLTHPGKRLLGHDAAEIVGKHYDVDHKTPQNIDYTIDNKMWELAKHIVQKLDPLRGGHTVLELRIEATMEERI